MKAIAQITVYEDGTTDTIHQGSAVIKDSAGEEYVNGEPVSQLSGEAQMILGISAHPTNTAVDHNQGGAVSSHSVSMNVGGETQVGNPGIGSRHTTLTGAQGHGDLNLGAFPAGSQASITLAADGAGTCSGKFVLVDRTGQEIMRYDQATDPTFAFTVLPKVLPNMPSIAAGLDAVIHADFAGAPLDVLVDVQAH